ncbi:hypothetical protein FNV43_RR16290 [Rhamnella rubrinervis]|uniref:Uncharacterized protein n=1 Tax=Rhamnella rubrinervis TaxID=2594499 RepID=A0A8K0GYI4_9ROSA|nr:hypothetical protein FNV43_RR16290 [Rhamnella rubrinervis]
MALVLAGSSFTMPKTNVVRMPTYKPCNYRLAIIKCRSKPANSDVSHGPGGGQINKTTAKGKENDTSKLNSNSENDVKKSDGGVGGVTPKKSSTTTASN